MSGVEHLKGRLLALPVNIRLGLKGLLMTNALAYLSSSSVTKRKVYMVANVIKLLSRLLTKSYTGSGALKRKLLALLKMLG
jgi:hypothetical protein